MTQLELIMKNILTKSPQTERDLFNLVRHELGKVKMPSPEKSALLKAYNNLLKKQPQLKNLKVEKFLTKRAVRTMSGVAVVSVLTKPQACPGNCLFCPTEKNMPKSYLSNEPAVMRAILNDFDPYRQIKMRLKALTANGHLTDKIELIVMGGTWSCHSPQYQNWFIKRCFEALNGHTSKTLKDAQKKNETAKHRCIGLTLETRPDYINEKEIKRLRDFGCTRVELGIQHIDDKILRLNHRGHSARQSIKAIKLLKNAGFKINLHLMPNLYGSTPAKDLKMFEKIYSDGDYMPDMIKIYPCVVNEHADLYKFYRNGKYRAYSDKQLLELIKKIKKITPPWMRITRLVRDIPEESIIAGNKITNLRQLIAEQAVKEGWSCQCIRCREAGHQKNYQSPKTNHQKLQLKIIKYQASGGTEYFLSFESADQKVLYAFLRLRIPTACHSERSEAESRNLLKLKGSLRFGRDDSHFISELTGAALIREVHTYGKLAGLNNKGEVQHLGLGKKLLQEAEKITKQNKLSKIAVISGIGVRQYYAKNGYRLSGTYMVKDLTK